MFLIVEVDDKHYNGHTEVVRLLLSHGADGSKKDQEGSTPLDDASYLSSDIPARELIIGLFRKFRPEVVMEVYCAHGGPQR